MPATLRFANLSDDEEDDNTVPRHTSRHSAGNSGNGHRNHETDSSEKRHSRNGPYSSNTKSRISSEEVSDRLSRSPCQLSSSRQARVPPSPTTPTASNLTPTQRSEPFTLFQKRYRSRAGELSKSFAGPLGRSGDYDDPDRNYFQTGLGQLLDANDSDEEAKAGEGFMPGYMKNFANTTLGSTGHRGQGLGLIGSSEQVTPRSLSSEEDVRDRQSGFLSGPGDNLAQAAVVAGSKHFMAGQDASTSKSMLELAANPEGRERLEWQAMLSSVLSGDVLRSEKTRIGGERNSYDVIRNELGINLWWGIRAQLRGRTVQEETKRVSQRRERTVDIILQEVANFKVTLPDAEKLVSTPAEPDVADLPSSRPSSPPGQPADVPSSTVESDTLTPISAYDQVLGILAQLSHAESLYPHIQAIGHDKPFYASPKFQRKIEALVSWSNVIKSLRTQISILQAWTGSQDLDVKMANTEEPIRGPGGSIVPGGQTGAHHSTGNHHGGERVGEEDKPLRPPTFVERVLKEDSLQRTFEKKTLSDVYTLISSAKATYLQHSEIFTELNLPPYQAEITKLISFPTQLVEESLRVRLAYAMKIENPTVMVIDQLLDDFRLGVALACTMKKQYGAVIEPDENRKWLLPPCMSETYDEVLLEALRFFFRLLHWKLKSGSKAVYFRETEILEDEWEFLNESAEAIKGGDLIVAEQFCSLTKKLMQRVINYFETQVRVPSSAPVPKPGSPPVSTVAPNLADGQAQSSKKSCKPPKALRNAFDEEIIAIESKTVADGKVSVTTTVAEKIMTPEEKVAWLSKVLEAVRMRYRKLQRFTRRLTNRFDNSAEYSLDSIDLTNFLASLAGSGHILIYTGSFETEGLFVIADGCLRDQPERLADLLTKAYPNYGGSRPVRLGRDGNPLPQDWDPIGSSGEDAGEPAGDLDLATYILVLAPTEKFFWPGSIWHFPLPWVELDLHASRARLIADGPVARLATCKDRFLESLANPETGQKGEEPPCVIEQQAHLPSVQRELRRIGLATILLSEAIVESVSHIRLSLRGIPGSQELIENWFAFSSDHEQRVANYMDQPTWSRFSRPLMILAIDWVAFICEDCDPTDHKTFRWTVNALEFAMLMTRGHNILHLDRSEFALLQEKVASCMALLIGHFDILGARSSYEAKKEQDRLAELRKVTASLEAVHDEDGIHYSYLNSGPSNDAALRRLVGEWNGESVVDKSVRLTHEARSRLIQSLEDNRGTLDWDMHVIGRVVDTHRPEDRSLLALAASSSNISIHWQQGRFIGAGAYGKVYTAHNMDQNTVMAVKEIRFSDVSNLPTVYKEIRDESSVMQMLNHINIVEYYGIEVHRDKVYIFQEYCDGGSLKDLLEYGRIEQEEVIMNYACQILEGLEYLHGKGIVHRDIKPDNVLLTSDAGIIKLVDFGAAKIIARGQRTINRTRNPGMNSLQGTPMYMSPEVIKNTPGGRLGAMDIWSVGCMILEFATGKKPWQSAENEWAIMYKIGAGELPPMPDADQISELGLDFILCCLCMNAEERPTAAELLTQHPWMTSWIEFRDTLGDPEVIADELANTSYINESSVDSSSGSYVYSEADSSLRHTPVDDEGYEGYEGYEGQEIVDGDGVSPLDENEHYDTEHEK
ncbi:ste ste11 protein kinase [Phaffia rhodozyma]|uniref:Ste ste11 protein kinase n=1 Tax=Phaffia rhodozyma TaxID=264483 RepID=A0A0F7SXT3_PHARH|nr:ste ste11 protein kinase [Phaffia rhodozyma]